ncbi:MAG: toxic anion resistance protein [Candidatus Fimisoma sp.]|nr:toxic anion resistance protein [Bacillota bacterium]MDD7285857.1 toxic anion resistance protein [Bacillota bacterium]MDY4748889.1 toxic anion resistance protein [Candidatus Fimisoma sp.]
MTDELKMEVPTLTLEPEKAEAEVPAEEIVPVNIEDKIQLSDEEMKVVDNFVKQIDISNTTHVLQYGADAQKKMADFSDMALEKVRTKDLGTVGDTLSELIVELKGFSALEEENKGIKGLFRKAANPVVKLKAKYDKAEVNVEKVVDVLEGHQVTLTKDIAVLDEMFAANNTNFKQLSMYIVAGKKKLEEAQNVTLPQLKAKAEASGEAADAQAANDFASMCNRFEKKLHDLDLTRTVSLQMAPQIRMVQNNDALMVEKIQTTLVNTIPLWKSQMVLALGLANNEAAVEAQKAVSDTTNELLKKNAEVLKKTTVDVARESERGIVDIETLKNTNRQLIETIDEVMKIQQEGREKRKAAEVELAKIELELKNKLLETRG